MRAKGNAFLVESQPPSFSASTCRGPTPLYLDPGDTAGDTRFPPVPESPGRGAIPGLAGRGPLISATVSWSSPFGSDSRPGSECPCRDLFDRGATCTTSRTRQDARCHPVIGAEHRGATVRAWPQGQAAARRPVERREFAGTTRHRRGPRPEGSSRRVPQIQPMQTAVADDVTGNTGTVAAFPAVSTRASARHS